MHLFNHKGWILGFLDDDNSSIEVASLRLTSRKVKGIILGGASSSDLKRLLNPDLYYKTVPNYGQIKENDIVSRQQFLDFFAYHLDTSPIYFRKTNEEIITEPDKNYRRDFVQTTMSLAYLGCLEENCKIILAGAPKLTQLEHLALSFSLEELRYVFFSSLDGYGEAVDTEIVAPCFVPKDFFSVVQSVAKEKFSDKLHGKGMNYTAGVFRKMQRLFDRNMLFTDNQLVDKLYDKVYVCNKLTRSV